MADLPSGAVTFLFTDIEGSTRLVRQLRGDYADVLDQHQRLLREAFARHGGHEIDTQGDAFFYAFSSAREAILAAIEAQRALAGYPWPDGASVKVRIGVHTGQSAPVNGRYTGLAVHRAARICAAGHGGQMLVSQATQSLLEDEEEDLATNLRDLGEQKLKDIERPVRLYQVAAPGLPESFPPLRGEKELPSIATPPPPWFRRPIVLAALAAAAVVVVGLIAALATRSAGGLGSVNPNTVAVIDTATNEIRAEVPVGTRPGPIAFGEQSIWVANLDDETLTRIDASSKEVVRTIPLQATPTGVAVTRGSVWVVHGRLGTVTRIDTQLDRVVGETDPGVGRSSGGAISAGPSGIWVALAGHFTAYVGRIAPASGRITASGFTGGRPTAIVVDGDAVWVANGLDTSTISQVDPRGATEVETTTVGRGPSAIAVGDGAVWVANTADDTVSRVDTKPTSVRAIIPVGDAPSAIAFGAGAVWVANGGDGSLSRIDPSANRVTKTISLGGRPEGVVVAAGAVWVAVSAE